MFNQQDGVIHFVFANPADQYVLSSLVRLDLRQYLRYQLRRNQCQSILFVRDESGKVILDPCDEDSAKIISGAGWFSGTADKIRSILKKNTQTAIVMELNVLNSLHKSNLNFVRELIGQLDACRRSQNLLVFTGTVNAEDSFPILTDPKGPFQERDHQGRFLCPELQNILRSKTQFPLYENLSRTMGERMRVLNYFDRTHLGRVVDLVLLHHPERALNSEAQQDLIDFIYCWYQFPALRERFPQLMEENRRMEFNVLEHELEQKEVWQRLNRATQSLREHEWSIRTALETICGPIDEGNMKLNIQAGDPVTNRFRQIALPAELGQKTKKRFNELRQFYTTSWNRPCSAEVDNYILESINILDTAVQRKDMKLVQSWIDSYYSYGQVRSCQIEKNRDYFNFLYYLVRSLEEMIRIQQENKKNEDEIERLRKEIPQARSNMKYDIGNEEVLQCLPPDEIYRESREWLTLSIDLDIRESTLAYGHEREQQLQQIVQYMKIELGKANREFSELPELDIHKLENHISDCKTKREENLRALDKQRQEAKIEIQGDAQEEYVKYLEVYLKKQDTERQLEEEKRHQPESPGKLEGHLSTEEKKRLERELRMKFN